MRRATRATRAAAVALCMVVVGVLGLSMSGCVERVEQARDTAQGVADDARQRAAQYESELAATRDALEEAQRLGLEAEARRLQQAADGFEAQLATATATAAAAQEAVDIANQALADAATTEGLFEQVPLLNLLPPPYREGAAMVTALALGFWRSRKLRGAATSIIASIEQIRKDDPEADALLKRHAPTLRSTQTDTARKLVDDVQTKRRPLVVV